MVILRPPSVLWKSICAENKLNKKTRLYTFILIFMSYELSASILYKKKTTTTKIFKPNNDQKYLSIHTSSRK